jgi:perosamine synthetase
VIPVFAPWLSENVRRYVLDCVDSGWISSLGHYVSRFEAEFAQFCEARHGIATSNGTTALHLALATVGIGPGDEVLVPDLTFVATANVVRYTGATPVLVDADPRTWTLDPDDCRRKLTARTRAIIPVHIYGHPADLDPLLALAAAHRLTVIEDAAEAHGARYKGRRVGALGQIGAFSFYGNKIITTGEGGMVVTNDAELAERARFLRDHAMDTGRRYYHPEIGFNYRMTNIQAAIGCAQLEQAEAILARRKTLATTYASELAGIPGLVPPPAETWAENVYWMYSVLVDPAAGVDREAVREGLRARGVDSRPFFVPLHELPPYASSAPFPVATRLGRTGINLPSGTGLTTEEIATVARALRELIGRGARP